LCRSGLFVGTAAEEEEEAEEAEEEAYIWSAQDWHHSFPATVIGLIAGPEQ